MVLFLSKDNVAQILSKYSGKEADGLTPIHSRRTWPIKPSSQICLLLILQLFGSRGSPLRWKGRRAVQKLLGKNQQELIICVAPYIPTSMGQAALCNPTWPWRAPFLNLSPCLIPCSYCPLAQGVPTADPNVCVFPFTPSCMLRVPDLSCI